MATLPSSYKNEIGSAVNWGAGGVAQSYENNPELLFPNSLKVYDQMRKTDGQIAAVLRAISLSIRGTIWKLMGSQVDKNVLAFIERELGLKSTQEGRNKRTDSTFNFDDFLRQALTFGPMGFSVFERTYGTSEGLDVLTGLDLTAHLNQLSFRPQRTINELVVNPDGSLAGVKQMVQREELGVRRLTEVFIPSDKLVVFCADREGGDWYGQSWLRSCWLNWTSKVQLTILDGIGHDRNSLGIPKVTYPNEGKSYKNEALKIASQMRAGDSAGVALSEGWTAELMGVTGSTKDPITSIKYHNEEIGRSLLAMVLNLGHDRGAQSLGDTMYDLFCASMNAVTAYIQEVVTEQVIRPLVELNFGSDAMYPSLVADLITPDQSLTPEQLQTLVDAGVITVDESLRSDIRHRYGLPPAESVVLPDGTEVEQTPIAEVIPIEKARPNPTPMAASRGSGLEELQARADSLRSKIDARRKAEVG